MAHRGDVFQNLINMACSQYNERGIAVIKEISAKQGRSRDGKLYFKPKDSSRTSLDYLGAYKFIPLTFDAKETTEASRFPLKNIEAHQIDIADKFSKHGIVFWLVSFVTLNRVYRIDHQYVKWYWEQHILHSGERGFGSIPLEEFETNAVLIKSHNGIILDFLNGLNCSQNSSNLMKIV